jgi:threonylcarbamoyladenosine tRNA methylthiotransferase MtaB
MRTFSIRNFGCRVNQAEAFEWAEALEEGGLRLEEEWSRSDLVLINSCSLTARADRDVRKFVQRAGRENPGARMIVTGCYAQRAREEFERMAQVLLVVPNGEKKDLAAKALALAGGGTRPAADEPADGAREAGASFRSRALLKVQDGCDNGCAFCIIPKLRGRSISVPVNDVLFRVRELAGRGFREIVLAGIHLSSYGKDRTPEGSLLGLLREIEKIEGLGRVRLSSLDPRRTDGALAAHAAGNPKICQHFHLSLQHASPRILKEMRRPVDPGFCSSILEDLRRRSPQAALGADIIVGFPGETEEDFGLLERFLAASPLTYFHVFPYSPRPGTPAAERPGVPDTVVWERARALRRLSAEKNRRFRDSLAGRTLEGVVVRKKDGWDDVLTENYIKVLAPRSWAARREAVRVRVSRVLPRSTEGEVLRP